MTSNKIIEGPQLKNTGPSQTLGQLFFTSAEKHAESICQIDGTTDQTETYGSVKTRSTRVAIEFQKRGITANDVIAFCTGNTIDTVIPILATFYVGAKVANLEPSLSLRQTRHLISLSQPKMIFVEEGSVNLIEDSLQAANLQAEIIVYGESEKYATLAQLTQPKDGEGDFRPAEVDVDEIAVLFFSSGTTGLPKAICHSHASFINIGVTMCELDLGSAVMHFTTFYWMTAVILLLQSYMVGGCRVSCQSFDPKTVLKTIEKYKVTMAFMAPVLLYQLIKCGKVQDYDTSSLRILQCGGTHINQKYFQEAMNLFKHSVVLNVYGMSEIGYVSSFHLERDEKFVKTRTKSSGKLVAGMKLKVVNEDTNETLGPNQKGEIRMHSPCLMKGYYKADASYVYDEDGFIKSGDVGYYDKDGCLYVIQRIKEMFKYQSYHIVPSALEAVLQEHPSVSEAVVFGVPLGDDGEAPGACVVLKEGHNVSEEEIFDFVAQRVSDREKLRGGVHFVSSLPKTPTGKPVRKEIRDLFVKTL